MSTGRNGGDLLAEDAIGKHRSAEEERSGEGKESRAQWHEGYFGTECIAQVQSAGPEAYDTGNFAGPRAF